MAVHFDVKAIDLEQGKYYDRGYNSGDSIFYLKTLELDTVHNRYKCVFMRREKSQDAGFWETRNWDGGPGSIAVAPSAVWDEETTPVRYVEQTAPKGKFPKLVWTSSGAREFLHLEDK